MKRKLILLLLPAMIFSISSCGKDPKDKKEEETVKKETFTIEYILDGGTNSTSNPSSYETGSKFTFADPSKNGYEFAGWFDENNQEITGISANTTGNLTLTAHWTPVQNSLSITSESSSKGYTEITEGSGYSDESITVVAHPHLGYTFDGWYDGSTKISPDTTYSFTMPANDYSLVARFKVNETTAKQYGIRPELSSDQKTMTFGLYPQTVVNNSATISALNALTNSELNGWYRYNNEYYAKAIAKPLNTAYKFDNGSTISDGTTYWFKCELITWNVLKKNVNEFYLLSSVLLDTHPYNDDQNLEGRTSAPNDYEDCTLRSWLNNEFYNTAFGLNNSHVLTTLVDNSAETTNSPYNHFWSNNTQDKVFLPSYQDYINTEYGFTSDTSSTETRYCRTTDYARAMGAYYSTMSWYQFNGAYWTRSPDTLKNGDYTAWLVNQSGGIGFDAVDYGADSIRPAINLNIYYY